MNDVSLTFPLFLRGPVPLCHLLLQSMLHDGDQVVDATCGNGHDTLLLARLVGSVGRVWGFDIQADAIAETGRRVAEAGLAERVTLLHGSHELLTELVPAPLNLVLFNLGYLPGGDRSVITRTESTRAALSQAVALLAAGGSVLVTIYPGHPGGDDERQAVEGWAASLEPRHYHSWRLGQVNVPATAPYLMLIQKAPAQR